MLKRRFILTLLLLTPLLHAESLSESLSQKSKLTPEQLASKKEGSYVTGIPLMGYDSDIGFGYGARVYLFENGKKDDTFFTITPYNQKLYMQFFQTTKGYSYHKVRYDAPYINNSLFRLTSEIVYEKNIQANYFGATSSSLENLQDTLGNSYTRADEQQIALDAQGSPYYNRYSIEKPKAEMSLARDFFGGLVRLSVGANISYASLRDYNNSIVLDQSNELSKLAEDKETLVGYGGGWDNGLKISAVYDSRDFEPNPKNGSVFDATAEFYGSFLGSAYSHERYTLSSRNYLTLDKMDFITFAFRGVYGVQSGNTPFYNKNILSFADEMHTGLGGYRSLRGYAQDRFIGDVKMLMNFESRFALFETHLSSERFEFMLVPFVDTGKVFDTVGETHLCNLKYTYGGGLRIAWNQATIIMMDYGQSVESSGLYISFGHIF